MAPCQLKMALLAAGGARRHLHGWIAAARCVQAAYRAHLFRRRLARGPARRAALLAGLLRLQARWRGRRPRQRFLAQRSAVIRLQARATRAVPCMARIAEEHSAWECDLGQHLSRQKMAECRIEIAQG
jgi:hypothetical protein